MKKLLLLTALSLLTSITHTMSDAAAVDEATTAVDDKLTELCKLNGYRNWPNRKELIMQLIEKNPANVNIAYSMTTPLHESIKESDISFARYLLKSKADVDKKDAFNRTPLYDAVYFIGFKEPDYQQLIELLIAYNANPDTTTNSNRTARSEATPEVKELIKQAEHKKAIKGYLHYLVYSLIVKYIPDAPSFIVINYLDERSPYFTPEYIARIEAKITTEDILLLLPEETTKTEEITSVKVKKTSRLVSWAKKILSRYHDH